MTTETVWCEWFARCGNEAWSLEPHPILGDVPICQRCADKLDTIDGLTKRGH